MWSCFDDIVRLAGTVPYAVELTRARAGAGMVSVGSNFVDGLTVIARSKKGLSDAGDAIAIAELKD